MTWTTLGAYQGFFKNLSIRVTSNTAVSVYADVVGMANSGAAPLSIGVSSSIATGVTGLNGVDTGSIAASKWYAVFAVSNGTTTGAVLTASQTGTGTTTNGGVTITSMSNTTNMSVGSPILGGSLAAGTTVTNIAGSTITLSQPAGAAGSGVSFTYYPVAPASAITNTYPYYVRIGSVLTNGSSNLLGTQQNGLQVQYLIGGPNVASLPVMASGTAGSTSVPTWVAVAVPGFVPPSASRIQLTLGMGTSAQNVMAAPNGNYGSISSTTNPPWMWAGAGNSNATGGMLLESANVYWASTGSGYLACGGWEENL